MGFAYLSPLTDRCQDPLSTGDPPMDEVTARLWKERRGWNLCTLWLHTRHTLEKPSTAAPVPPETPLGDTNPVSSHSGVDKPRVRSEDFVRTETEGSTLRRTHFTHIYLQAKVVGAVPSRVHRDRGPLEITEGGRNGRPLGNNP